MSSNRSETGGAVAAPLPPEIAQALADARPRLGRLATSVIYFPTVASTNDVAARLAGHGGVEGAVVLADAQTAGRGRRGRDWFSPPGSGLYVSVLLTPGRARDERAIRATGLVTLTAGLALAEAVAAATGLSVDVKWPNDLYVARRKLAGILAEGVAGGESGDVVILGYGINVVAAAYPPELRDRATSLESEVGRPVDRALIFAESLVALARRYDDLLAGRFDAILDGWRARSPGAHGARVAWTTAGGELSGTTAGIAGDGALLVRIGDRIERIVAGVVQWL